MVDVRVVDGGEFFNAVYGTFPAGLFRKNKYLSQLKTLIDTISLPPAQMRQDYIKATTIEC